MKELSSRSVTTRNLDSRALGLIKKLAHNFLAREDVSEPELDQLIAHDFQVADT
jgi:hypothetical protein